MRGLGVFFRLAVCSVLPIGVCGSVFVLWFVWCVFYRHYCIRWWWWCCSLLLFAVDGCGVWQASRLLFFSFSSRAHC